MDEIKENNKTEKKVSKKVARSTKNAAKKTTKADGSIETSVKKEATVKKSLLINDGKCCRCTGYNKEHKCVCKKSAQHGKYTARKNGCECFKYKF